MAIFFVTFVSTFMAFKCWALDDNCPSFLQIYFIVCKRTNSRSKAHPKLEDEKRLKFHFPMNKNFRFPRKFVCPAMKNKNSKNIFSVDFHKCLQNTEAQAKSVFRVFALIIK